MKKLITLICFVVLLVQVSVGQLITNTIRGKVVDEQSKMGLPGVTIILIGSEPLLAVSTDADGEFRLKNVPVGRQGIQARFIGYETVTLSNLTLVSGKELFVQINMIESIDEIEAVEVVAKQNKQQTNNEMATVSARTLSVDEAMRFSGSLQDPSRMAQNYAGVSGASDNRNDIIIRGNSPLGVLWRMEGVDIPSPNHFSTLGTTGGPISMLNINNLSNSDFMTSAWSADYGNALSGVFDIKLRSGNHDKREYLGQIGFNGLELGAEGPFKKGKKASYLVNGRYSTLGVMTAIGLDLGVGSAVPEYKDMTFKIDIPTTNAGRFNIWGVLGNSEVKFDASPEIDSTNLFSENDQNSTFGSETMMLGASWIKFLNDNTYLQWTGAHTRATTAGLVTRVDFSNNEETLLVEFDQFQAKVSNHLKLNKKINKKNTISVGLLSDNYFVDILDSGLARFKDSIIPYNIYETITDSKGNAFLIQSYLNWQHRFNKKLTLNSGLHEQYFALTNHIVAEPRLGLAYQMNVRHKFSAGMGLHSQIQPITLYFVESDTTENLTYPNQDVGFSKAWHGVVSHDFIIGSSMRLKTEVYGQYLFNIPIENTSSYFSMVNQGADFILPDGDNYVNKGTGYNYGVEFTLERFLNKGFYLLYTTSLFESKFRGSDDTLRNTVFNGNYVLNALAGKELKVNSRLTISIDSRVTYSGGRRYIPINLEESINQNRQVLDQSSIYENQYDPYFRWDLKLGFQLNGKRVSQKWMIDIQNITNHNNVFLTQYNKEANQLVTTYQRGFFPIVLYQIYF